MSPSCHQSIQRPSTSGRVERAVRRRELSVRLSGLLRRKRRWFLGAVALGGYLAVATAANAATDRPAIEVDAASPTDAAVQRTPAVPARAPTALVSARYQGKNGDTAAETEPAGSGVAESEPAVAAPASPAPEKTVIRLVIGHSTAPTVARSALAPAGVVAKARTVLLRPQPQPTVRRSTLQRHRASALQYQLRVAISRPASNHFAHAASAISKSTALARHSAGTHTWLSISERTTVHVMPIARLRSASIARRTAPPTTRRPMATVGRSAIPKVARSGEVNVRLAKAREVIWPTQVATRPPGAKAGAKADPGVDARLTDGRLMLQLALAFGVVYVLFLAFWFWGTRDRARDRARRVGGAARF